MPADVILEMRVKWGRNGNGERRKTSPNFGWTGIDSFLSLFSPRGTPKSHLRIGESCRKRTLSTRGIGPAKRWYCYKGIYSPIDRCDPDCYILLHPDPYAILRNYFAPGSPKHSRTLPKTSRNYPKYIFALRFHCLLCICIFLL